MPKPRKDDLSNLQKAQQALEAGNAASGQAFAVGGAPPPTGAIEQAIGDQYPQGIEDIYRQFPSANPSFSLPEEASNFNFIGTANAGEVDPVGDVLKSVDKGGKKDPLADLLKQVDSEPSGPTRVTGLDALQQAHDRMVRPMSVEQLGQQFNAPPQMLATARENAPEVGAMVGGAAGTAIGTALGTPLGPLGQVPLGMAGGATGSAMGTSLGHMVKGDEPVPGELATSAILGAVPLGMMNLARPIMRVLGGIPSLRQAVKLSASQLARGEVEARFGVAKNLANRQASVISNNLKKIQEYSKEIKEAPFVDKSGKPLTGTALDAVKRSRQAKVNEAMGNAMDDAAKRLDSIYSKEFKREFLDPLASHENALKLVTNPDFKQAIPGSLAAGLAFLQSGSFVAGGLAGVVAYGIQKKGTQPAIRFLVRNSPAFKTWISGIKPRDPLVQGAFTFMTQVLANAKTEEEVKNANTFYHSMLDYIEENPGQAFAPSEPTGEDK